MLCADASVYQYKDSFIELIRRPGLGVEINEEKVREAEKRATTWKNPIWRNYDGTIAEW